MPLRFTKMHGLGNDYIFISLFDQAVADPPRLAQAISDRHRGVGSDGLILIAPPGDDDVAARMWMFNADGSRAQMCGNGIRCMAKLLYERGLARHNPLRIATDAGVLTLDLSIGPDDRVAAVRVDMGVPALAPRQIPVALDGQRVVARPLSLGARRLEVTLVSMGNPHAVFFTDRVADVPLASWGPELERHPLFPERINVHFAQVLSRQRVRMVTWERGSGTTQACGTGACAVCVAGVLNDFTQREISVELPGGELDVVWDAATDHVHMAGPATEVFNGEWPT
jgi:diaminopimelate epimerase